MQSDIERIEEILVRNRGFITSAQVTEAGIPRRCLTALTEIGRVYKVDRGIYALPEFWEDDFLIFQYRFSKGIYSHETALFLHAMTDRTPSSYTMTFPKSYNSGNVRAKNIKVRYSMPENYELGLCELLSPSQNPIKVYNVERTLCDIVKTKHAGDIQVINQAMKSYAVSRDRDIGRLMKYATQLGVRAKISNYMEVLL